MKKMNSLNDEKTLIGPGPLSVNNSIPECDLPFLTHQHNPASNTLFSPHHFTSQAMVRNIGLTAGESIYRQEQLYQGFWYLHSGVVGLYHSVKNGDDILVRIYQHNEWFGFAGLAGQTPYHCTARLMLDARLSHIIPYNEHEFLLHFPAFCQFLLIQMANALSDAEHRLAWIARFRTRYRVLSSLWYLTHHFPGYHWTWRDVAEFAGCETETALRFTKELRTKGILDDTQRRLHVCNAEQLAALLI